MSHGEPRRRSSVYRGDGSSPNGVTPESSEGIPIVSRMPQLWSYLRESLLGTSRKTRRRTEVQLTSPRGPDGTGRNSPVPDFATKDSSAAMKVQTEEELKEEWVDALTLWGFDPACVEEYSTSLSEQCVSVEIGAVLEESQMQELGIRIGHRKGVKLAAVMARRTGAIQEDSTAPAEQHAAEPAPTEAAHDTHPMEVSAAGDGIASPRLQAGTPLLTNQPSFSTGNTVPTAAGCSLAIPTSIEDHDFKIKHHINQRGAKWHACSGGFATMGEFYTKITTVRQHIKFPKTFDRAFLDNKPMPFTDQDGVYTLVVLRIPDLDNERGTTVATITNRLVLMFSTKHRVMLTYHRCDIDPLERLAMEWEEGLHANSTIYQVIDAVNRCFVKAYRHGLRILQEQIDDFDDENDMVAVVEGLTLIQKKAAVYKRCLNAGRVVLEELQELSGLEDYIPLVCETAQSLESMLDEANENAVGSISMHMALDGFHSSRNTKVFTYISLVCQPITLATGWYGMNWTNFPELYNDQGYFVFTGVVVTLAFSLLALFLYQFEIKPQFRNVGESLALRRRGQHNNSGDWSSPTMSSEESTPEQRTAKMRGKDLE